MEAGRAGERDVPRRDRHALVQAHLARVAKRSQRQDQGEEEEGGEHRDGGAGGEGQGREHALYAAVRDSKMQAKRGASRTRTPPKPDPPPKPESDPLNSAAVCIPWARANAARYPLLLGREGVI